jgi:hypothetical protein
MNITTFLLILTLYVFAIMASFLIENRTHKIFYFMIIGLATLTVLNIYFGIVYYIKLRNDPGMPGPRGPKGEKGASGASGKCVINEKCGFSIDDAKELIYTEVAKKYDTTPDCLRDPTIEKCGSIAEVQRLEFLKPQIQILIDLASDSAMTKQEFTIKLNTILN